MCHYVAQELYVLFLMVTVIFQYFSYLFPATFRKWALWYLGFI